MFKALDTLTFSVPDTSGKGRLFYPRFANEEPDTMGSNKAELNLRAAEARRPRPTKQTLGTAVLVKRVKHRFVLFFKLQRKVRSRPL